MNMESYAVRPTNSNAPSEKVQTLTLHRTVQGFYKASIMEADADGNINESFSTGWKPNTILNSGLDKIAYMPWAQTFQFCLIGDHPYGPSDPLTASYSETMLRRPKKIHAFYLPGEGNCGHQVSGSTVRMFRTFDFYKENEDVTYTEVGFKETPAAPTLFSKIRFQPSMSLHAGQFMRVAYELRVNMSPATGSSGGVIPSPYPTFTGWTSGSGDREAIQKVGLCGIDSGSGLAIPIDEGGFCNEPFAPGTINFGPANGFVNRWYNGANVNYYPTASGDTSYEQNPFKAIGPLTEYNIGYQNIFPLLDAGISQSLIIEGGKYSGSFCVPYANKYLPRNYFTTDMIWGGMYSLGSSSVYDFTSTSWNGSGDSSDSRYVYVYIYSQNGINVSNTAFNYSSNKFSNLDNLWTPYCKLGTLSSTGVTPISSTRLNNTNLFTDGFYDISMQTSGSLSYVYYPSKYAVPGGTGTGSKYEPSQSYFNGRELAKNYVGDKTVPVYFPYWDDWNPYISSSQFPGSIKYLSNYWVRGTNVFLSTHTGSAVGFTSSIDRSSNTSSKVYSVEVPTLLVPYTPGTYTREKYAVFNNLIANNADINSSSYWPNGNTTPPLWKTIGVGPTSLLLEQSKMTDASKYNGYVYIMDTPNEKTKDYSLKVVLKYTWGRAT